ncbi:MAG: hypothetical protein IJT88_08850 [Kiritimatiellae bacterium]|nr:hypothetical protein [Kiritimatiellia bacterium]MBQ9345303.1 hypothetical protein [Kiritimatiellia bacterium]
MKKMIALLVSMLILASVSLAAPVEGRGGFLGGIHGCCFGLRGAAAYNEGKNMTALEWIDALVACHIIAFVKGCSGITTSDLKASYGESFF